MSNIFFFVSVALGGALGSILRELFIPILPFDTPWISILLINALASFIIGIVYGLEQSAHPRLKDFYAIGFCGGFSTFSHFSLQTHHMLVKGQFVSAFLNVSISLLAVLLFVLAGLKLGALIELRKKG